MTTITRLQYGTEVPEDWTSVNTGTNELGLQYTTVTKAFDGSITSTGLNISDAFGIDEFTVSDSHSKGLVAMAGAIALIQQQERCVPTEMDGTADPDVAANTDCLIVPGFEMDESTMEADTDTEHEEYVPMEEDTTLATALGVDRLFLFPASKAVSFAGTLSGVSVLCDGRTSMVGYSVDGAADVAWVPVPWSWWKTLDETLRSDLLTALGLSDIGDTADESGLCQGITVTDGVLSGDVELSDKQRLFFAPNGDTDNVRQFGEVTVDGIGYALWPENTNYVAAVFAAVPKISMESVLGLAAVFVGIDGGVPQWMVTAVKTYGIPLANLVKAASYDINIHYAFDTSSKTRTLRLHNATVLCGLYFPSGFRIIGKVSGESHSSSYGSIVGWANEAPSVGGHQYREYLQFYNNSNNELQWGFDSIFEAFTYVFGTPILIDMSIVSGNGFLYVDGTSTFSSSVTFPALNNTTYNELKFGGTTTNVSIYAVQDIYDESGNRVGVFAPIEKEGKIGLINLLDMTFCEATNGTYELENVTLE